MESSFQGLTAGVSTNWFDKWRRIDSGSDQSRSQLLIYSYDDPWGGPPLVDRLPFGHRKRWHFVDHVESWFRRPLVHAIHPGPRHAELAFGFLRAEGSGGNLTTDAHLAALAVEANATVYTMDTDFLRFPNVKWKNPIG